jgi:hypothetical protein
MPFGIFCMRFYGDVGEEMANNELRLEKRHFWPKGLTRPVAH